MCELGKLDKNATTVGSDKSPTATVGSCPEWKLNVIVKSKVQRWPEGNVKVWLALRDGTYQPGDKVTKMTSATAPAVPFSGKGKQTYMARASTGDYRWKLVEQEVTVSGSDERDLDLVIEPAKWISFKLVDAGSAEVVEGATVKLELPGGVPKELKTKQVAKDAVDEGVLLLDKDGKTKLTEVSHADVWEFVELSSS